MKDRVIVISTPLAFCVVLASATILRAQETPFAVRPLLKCAQMSSFYNSLSEDESRPCGHSFGMGQWWRVRISTMRDTGANEQLQNR
ncbi:MAG TPA: hypothetical protein DCP63_13775 [Bacteroidetes bacterium]|nr:hypothetical protein [Bacteroidota bacterium]